MLTELEIEKISNAVALKLSRQPGGGAGSGGGEAHHIVFEKPGKVAKALNVSPSTLKRRRESGVFREGWHYIKDYDKGGREIFLYNRLRCSLDVDKLSL